MKAKPKAIRVKPPQAFVITAKTPTGKIIRLIQLNSQRCTLDFK